MELKDAQTAIQTVITAKQSELDTLSLALTVLNTTFAPDLTALADAQALADTKTKEVEEVRGELETAQAEKATVESELETASAQNADLTNQVGVLQTPQVDGGVT